MAEAPHGRLLLLVGVLAVGLGAVATVAPGTVTVVSRGDVAMGLLGLLALVLAFRSVGDYLNAERSAAGLPDADRTALAPAAGSSFDRALGRSAERDPAGHRHRRRVVRTLRGVAVDSLSAVTGDDPAAVEARLDAGTWTDDPVAAALFTAETEPTRADRVRALLGRETTFQRRARRAVAALERRAGGRDDA